MQKNKINETTETRTTENYSTIQLQWIKIPNGSNLWSKSLTKSATTLGDDEPASGNSNHARVDDNHVPAPTEKPPPETSHKKEKSVLQAKLTKLAIQVSVVIWFDVYLLILSQIYANIWDSIQKYFFRNVNNHISK